MSGYWQSADPREFGLTAEDLRAVANLLYTPGDPRRMPWGSASERFGGIRSRLRLMADAIEEPGAAAG